MQSSCSVLPAAGNWPVSSCSDFSSPCGICVGVANINRPKKVGHLRIRCYATYSYTLSSRQCSRVELSFTCLKISSLVNRPPSNNPLNWPFLLNSSCALSFLPFAMSRLTGQARVWWVLVCKFRAFDTISNLNPTEGRKNTKIQLYPEGEKNKPGSFGVRFPCPRRLSDSHGRTNGTGTEDRAGMSSGWQEMTQRLGNIPIS